MIRRTLTAMALIFLAACSADVAAPPAASYEVALALDPVTMRAGDSIAPSVTVTVNGVARPANSREILVSSSDTSVIAVAPNGALMSVGDGSANITVLWVAASSISVTRLVTIQSENLATVSVIAPATMVPGDTATFAVTGTIRGGRVVRAPVSVEVTSRNPAVAAASGNQVVAVAGGSAWIVAHASTGVSDSSLVVVAVGPTAHLTLSPHVASLVAGGTLQATAVMADRRDNPITAIPPSFTSSAAAVATVGVNGNITAVAAGTALIVAASGAVADTLRLTVTAPAQVLARLVVSPDSVTLNPGGATPIQVQALDAQGKSMALPALTWQSETSGITVSSSGVIQAAATITGTISNGTVRVSSGGVSTTVRVAVVIPPVPAPILARLMVLPDSVTLSPGASTAIQVQAFDTHGNVMTLPALTWASQTTGITVTAAGVIQAAAAIAATIPNGSVQVSSGTVTAQVRVAVVVAALPPPASDGGYVQIRWVGTTPSAGVAAAFEAARLRINGLFNSFNGVPPSSMDLVAGTCMTGAPAMNETVPGIVIFAQVTTIDGVGNILGSAGPCIVRNNSWLPVVGAMQFDVADMNSMIANGSLNGVVLHEMMHTLGFGTIWAAGLQGEVAAPNGADPRYLGANGQSAYTAAGGLDAVSGVPVENTGGSGTRGSHWRESIFHTELMTGWADGPLQLSRVTIGALKDFGYDVNLNKADAFTLSTSLRGASLVASQQLGEQTSTPIGVVGSDGTITPYHGPVVH